MAGRDALIMGTRSAGELRDYLRRTHSQPIHEFDDFQLYNLSNFSEIKAVFENRNDKKIKPKSK